MISQIDLVSSIFKHLEKQGVKTANTRQMNAVVSAATNIVEAFSKPHAPATEGMGLQAWLMSDDTGSSSLWIARFLGGGPPSQSYAYPHDADDFGRCYRLLKAVPEFRERLPELATSGEEWAALVANWIELEAYWQAGDYKTLTDRIQELTDSRG